MMKASAYNRYGSADVVHYQDVAEPSAGKGQVRVRVHAAALNPKDVLVRKGKFKVVSGRRFPRIPGYDFAGVVDALGPGTTGIEVGARVFGMLNGWSGGSCAQWLVAPRDELALLPSGLTMQQGAALPLVGLTALQALRDCLKLKTGDSLLINGASGGVGTVAVQIAVALGAVVTAVCSRRNEQLVRGLGAHQVIAYDEQDPFGLSRRYDAVFDVFGSAPYGRAKAVLRIGGRYVTAIPTAASALREALARVRLSRARLVVVRSNHEDLEQLARWSETGKLRAVIDRVVDLEKAIEGHRHIESKRARGKVVISVLTSAA